MAELIIHAEGKFEIDFLAQTTEASIKNFCALYDGENFKASERGILGIIASGHGVNIKNEDLRDAVQTVVYSFAEGYFEARRTFSNKHAAFDALSAVNRWLLGHVQGVFGQSCISLSAVLICGRRIGLVQAGACQIYRLRGNSLTPLVLPHARPANSKFFMPTRALGLEESLMPDWADEEVEEKDIYIFIAGLEGIDNVYSNLLTLLESEQKEDIANKILHLLNKFPGTDKSVMVLRVCELTNERNQYKDHNHFADLPIRAAPREGDVIDGFQIGPALHKGIYTAIFSARDLLNNQDVAIKFPFPSILDDKIFLAGFMREAWIGAAIHSKVVIKYIDLPEARRNSLYLVMPLYQGETLEKRLSRLPMVNLVEGIEISIKLCEAVQDLAAIEVLHRDLKPENVIILENGELKLIDLGLAYLSGLDTETTMGPAGSVRYLAPELLKGKSANARTEVYSLSIMFYRVFSAGAFPYGQRETYPLQKLRPDLPAWLGAVLAKGLSENPEKRFANAGELAEALCIGLREGKDVIESPQRSVFNNVRIFQGTTILFFVLFVLSLLLFA